MIPAPDSTHASRVGGLPFRTCSACGYELPMESRDGRPAKCPECGQLPHTPAEGLQRLKLARAASCILIAAIPAWVGVTEFETQTDFIPMQRSHALLFVAIATACALALPAAGYLRFSRLMQRIFVIGALLPILLISARNFNIENHATIVRTDIVWQVLVWSDRMVFSLTIAFGVFALSSVCRECGCQWRVLATTTTTMCLAVALLLATLVGPWAVSALWDAAQGMWQPTPPNATTSPPVPNLIGIQSFVECLRIAIVFGSLLWLWTLALFTYALVGARIDMGRG